jgi:hypothetical protein
MQQNNNKYPLPNSKLLFLYALIEYAYFVANRAQIFKASNDKGYATTFHKKLRILKLLHKNLFKTYRLMHF